ncbi:hypothetical protein F5050DRAFT_1754339 [Lentinula boryana]|uniref:Uncharacterized protein n=1 Tax=Lentinula boryana TaxID=40481 RepID=A0ABQ8QF81_9AGAR|nr:hypothetical protein F5050DRAFT_1754339 [Lentinula boryana]
MPSGVTLFHKLFITYIVLISCLGVIASPVIVFTLRPAGFVVDAHSNWMLAFLDNKSKKILLFGKDATNKVEFEWRDNSDNMAKHLNMFKNAQSQNIELILIQPVDEVNFLSASTKMTQGAEWIESAMEQLIIRHNSKQHQVKKAKMIPMTNIQLAKEQTEAISKAGGWGAPFLPLPAGFIIDAQSNWMLAFLDNKSKKILIFSKNATNKVEFEWRHSSNNMTKHLKMFKDAQSQNIELILEKLVDEANFLSTSTKMTQGAEWIESAMEQLIIRHNFEQQHQVTKAKMIGVTNISQLVKEQAKAISKAGGRGPPSLLLPVGFIQSNWMLAFHDQISNNILIFSKNANNKVNFEWLKSSDNTAKDLIMFKDAQSQNIELMLLSPSEEVNFLSASTETTQGAEWVKSAMGQLIYRHNGNKHRIEAAKNIDGADIELVKKQVEEAKEK